MMLRFVLEVPITLAGLVLLAARYGGLGGCAPPGVLTVQRPTWRTPLAGAPREPAGRVA